MPIQPSPEKLHVNQILTEFSIKYMQDEKDFMADQVFPNIPVKKQTDIYATYPKEYWFRTQMEARAPGTQSKGVGFDVNYDNSYRCVPKAEHYDITEQHKANADSVFELEKSATQLLSQHALLRREKDFVDAYWKSGVWGTDFTPATLWSDGNSEPLKDVDEKKTEMRRTTGKMPNVFIMGPEVWSTLKHHPTVIDRISPTSRQNPTLAILAEFLEIDRCLVAYSSENLAPEGKTGIYDFIADPKSALLVYAAPSPSTLLPSAGYTFSWKGYLENAGPQGQTLASWYMREIKSTRVEIEMAWSPKLIAADLGIYFDTVIS